MMGARQGGASDSDLGLARMRRGESAVLEELPEELADFLLRGSERCSSFSRGPVEPPAGAARPPVVRPEVSRPFHSVENGVERPGAQLIAVMRQLLDNPEAVDRLLGGVVEDMQPDESRIKILFVHVLSILDIQSHHSSGSNSIFEV